MKKYTADTGFLPNDTSGLPVAVQELDFKRLKHKFTTSSDAVMTPKEWEAAEPEYRRFLALKVLYPGVSLIPSKPVEKVWHAHILDTRAYREDCEKVFGRYIDHYPYFGLSGDHDSHVLHYHFQKTIELYQQHFDPYPKSSPNSENHGVSEEVTA